ncbi:DUF6894 family protein [Methylobacterium oxalidis]|uniref:DUF6894 domain-containing protein n=1 Tax=Methylobacterium oxalidis TaxID=944322 RepID=A0A512JAL4_9HYPH|nr:hypothetical protein [Methylobacterium oxalidis]GEP07008.1 hypothetical protein MOX02_50460 [Methylobacterium oxalidis]GJE29840.1 hypothetical protein LDDCCGHA_0002 [Methylobacterium oxalidis]GLS64639.1 hypothetical protein GCM10007888_30200 [Methylobacterium oxalidis]
MPRYFFDVHDGGPQSDDTGTELASRDEARAKAKSLLPDIAREEIPKGDDQSTFTVLVRDENNHPVYSATLTFAGSRLQS